jgi:hypothetical protein
MMCAVIPHRHGKDNLPTQLLILARGTQANGSHQLVLKGTVQRAAHHADASRLEQCHSDVPFRVHEEENT